MADSIIPRDLRLWKRVEPPKYKKDYVGKLVQTHGILRREYDPAVRNHVKRPDSLVPDGAVLTLRQRYPNGDGQSSTLVCDWPCPACGHKHERSFNDSTLADGRLHFVEERDYLADDGQFLYLASPYSHPDPAVRQQRWLDASEAAAWLMSGGGDIMDNTGAHYTVYSPIAMGHPISVMGEHYGLGHGFDHWCQNNWAFLDAAAHYIALQIEGWQKSVGMREELAYTRKRGLGIWAMGKGGDGKWGIYLCPDLSIPGPMEETGPEECSHDAG